MTPQKRRICCADEACSFGKVCTNSLSKANAEVESGAVRSHLGFSKTCGRPTGYSAVRAEEDMGVPRASDRAVKAPWENWHIHECGEPDGRCN